MADLAALTPGVDVLVAGARVTGRSVLAALEPLGVRVTLCDDDPASVTGTGTTPLLSTADAASRVGDFALVVVSPGFAPEAPTVAAAAAAGVPVWGDVELAWHLDRSGRLGPPRRWLAVTGTNGKTTTTSMLAAMLAAADRTAVLCGNIGRPVTDALTEPAELLAVELSSFQLHWAPSLRPDAGVVLNVAEDHLDWHGTFDRYAAAKARALRGRVAVAGLDDPVARALLADSPAAVRVGFTLGAPGPDRLGVRDGALVDGAFGGAAPGVGGEVVLADLADVPVAGQIGVLDALGAAALARAVDVPAEAIARGLRGFEVGRHRAECVGTLDGVRYVDDSKATNPHAVAASIATHPRVVWVAGGLLKGAAVDDTVAAAAPRLAGAVLIGRDRAVIADALARHAPHVPVVLVDAGEDAVVRETDETPVTRVTGGDGRVGERVMAAVVAAARRLARPGDTVLLAPAGASFDQFRGYAHRGDAFAAAARDVGAR